jgi:hypothetical protein
MYHDCTCRNDTPITYLDATEDYAFGTEPATVANENWFCSTKSSTSRSITDGVATCDKLNSRSDITPIADHNRRL